MIIFELPAPAVAWSVSVRVRPSPDADPFLEIDVKHDGSASSSSSFYSAHVTCTSSTGPISGDDEVPLGLDLELLVLGLPAGFFRFL